MPNIKRMRSSNIQYYLPIDPEIDDKFDDNTRFEFLEKKIAKQTDFPIFMAIPYVTILLSIIAVLALPMSSGLAIAGFIHLSIISYGIVNDMLATRDSIEYFRFGHNPGQLDVCIPSTNKNAQAFHWGILATWLLSAIGSGIIGIIAAAVPVSPIIFPVITILVISALIGAQLWSGAKAESNIPHDFAVPSIPLMDVEPLKWWNRCNLRNSFGYLVLPLIGVTLAICIGTGAINALGSIVALSVLASPLAPIVLAVPMLLLIGGMAINFLRHRNTIELDQTLPRKFGTNPNFEIHDEDQRLSVKQDVTQIFDNSLTLEQALALQNSNAQAIQQPTSGDVVTYLRDAREERANSSTSVNVEPEATRTPTPLRKNSMD